MSTLIRVRDVKLLGEYRVKLGLTDGSERETDLEPYLRGPIFEPLRRDPSLFASMTVDDELGTIVWPNGADIDPDVLYGTHQPAAWTEPAATRRDA